MINRATISEYELYNNPTNIPFELHVKTILNKRGIVMQDAGKPSFIISGVNPIGKITYYKDIEKQVIHVVQEIKANE